jgi:transposase
MMQRGGQVVIRMLENVRQVTIHPLIQATIAPGTLVLTDEYDIYCRLPAWGYNHKTVCHGAREYARDEDGDGFHEVHVNTIDGFWSLLRSWLRPHRGDLTGKSSSLPWLLRVRSQRQKSRKATSRIPLGVAPQLTTRNHIMSLHQMAEKQPIPVSQIASPLQLRCTLTEQLAEVTMTPASIGFRERNGPMTGLATSCFEHCGFDAPRKRQPALKSPESPHCPAPAHHSTRQTAPPPLPHCRRRRRTARRRHCRRG